MMARVSSAPSKFGAGTEAILQRSAQGCHSSGLSSPRRSRCRHKRQKKALAQIPLGRLTTPADIADLAAFFFASERASFIIGTVSPVDGGS